MHGGAVGVARAQLGHEEGVHLGGVGDALLQLVLQGLPGVG